MEVSANDLIRRCSEGPLVDRSAKDSWWIAGSLRLSLDSIIELTMAFERKLRLLSKGMSERSEGACLLSTPDVP